MRVLVCGGRDYSDGETFARVIHSLPVETIIHGGARGADYMAHVTAVMEGWEELEFPADWETHGKAAGPIRNQQMIDEGKPDLVVAFPGGRGTADMVRRAHRAGIPVREIAK